MNKGKNLYRIENEFEDTKRDHRNNLCLNQAWLIVIFFILQLENNYNVFGIPFGNLKKIPVKHQRWFLKKSYKLLNGSLNMSGFIIKLSNKYRILNTLLHVPYKIILFTK